MNEALASCVAVRFTVYVFICVYIFGVSVCVSFTCYLFLKQYYSEIPVCTKRVYCIIP